MRLHNFFIDQNIGTAKRVKIEDMDLLHQLKNVFRLEKGGEIILLDNSGYQFRSKVELLTKTEGVFEILEATENTVKPARGVCLCVSMIKKDNFEWILEKGTELGVSFFLPLVSERSIKTNFNHERGVKIMKEASEQSGRAKLPGLHKTISLHEALEGVRKDKFFAFAFHPTGKKFDPKIADPKMNAVFIGPEGGWSDKELEDFKKYGVEIYSLGDQTLRAETAAIAAATLLLI